MVGNLVNSRNTQTDGAGTHLQLTNIYYEASSDKLYVTANDFSSAEGYPQTSPNGWVYIYNACNLSFDSFHLLGSRITEAIWPWNGYWWEVGWDTHQIHQIDSSWNLVASHNLSGPNYF